MLIQQLFTPKIAHSSYILAGSQSCAVVDPQRDVDIYLYATRARSLQPLQRHQPQGACND